MQKRSLLENHTAGISIIALVIAVAICMGLSNKAVWTNTDSVPHSVTSDNNYKDVISGSFNSIDHIGLIPPGGKFTYVFTADGVYPYHCEPHPWMQGKVTILKEKF
jgi:hypothetical protein